MLSLIVGYLLCGVYVVAFWCALITTYDGTKSQKTRDRAAYVLLMLFGVFIGAIIAIRYL